MPFIIQKAQEDEEDELSPEENQKDQVFEVERSPEGPKTLGEEFGVEYEKLAELLKSGGKGFIEGISRLGRSMGPLQDPEMRSEKEIQEEQTGRLDELIPSEGEEDFLQRSLRRGLKEAPTMLSFPGSQLSTLPRSIAAGFLGEGAKDLGLPEWAQTAAELTAYMGPELTNKLLSWGSNKDIIKMGKEFGLTNEQITPLIQKDFKTKWLSKLSPKRGRTQKVLDESRKGLGEAYDVIKKSPTAMQELPTGAKENLLTKFQEVSKDLPSSVVEKIEKDLANFLDRPMTGESLMTLHKHINKATGPFTKELVAFKKPIADAITAVSPELGQQFQNLNNLYSRYASIAGKLKPTIVSDLVTAGEAIGLVGGAIYGDYNIVQKMLIEQGAKITAREVLLNPRVNQLVEKFLLALNQHKWGLASKIGNQVNDEIKKMDNEIDIQEFTEEQIKELFGV